ncbi:PREDICTED: inner nuclear membrane protein Man1 [Drosophila arizonae]|uniref:Inner nuclear membrane protein Man1 n=1 Tax=Drosophila arizonae TaxID=7263 RepID=A0ABM1PI81_DROAR|nr:PREDICTED: inner nuclear membrane protein Man1 [Drosophila arizonae]
MDENLNSLTDIEIQRKLQQFGYANTPVTETTRPILIKKLMKHIKKEKLQRVKVNNYVLYYNDKQNTHPAIPIQENPNIIDKEHENNKINTRLSSSLTHRNDANESMGKSSRLSMYAPPPLITSHYENENEPHSLSIHSRKPIYPAEKPAPYYKIYDKSNNCDGGVVNRLLSFRDASIKKKIMFKDGYSTHSSKTLMGNGIIQKLLSFDLRSFLKKPDASQYIIPPVLIGSLFIFLALISVLYTAKKFDLSPITQTDIKYTICNMNDIDLRGSAQKVKCISEDQFNKALYICKELFGYLNERARLHHCISEDHSATLEMNDFKKALSRNTEIQNGNLHNKLLATQYLIAQNPQWMIKTIVSTYNSTEPTISFELIEPNLPLKCLILKKMTRFFTVIGLVILTIAGFFLIYFLSSLYRMKQKESLQLTEQFKKDIINELMYHSTHSENSEIIINQLQDKLLPPHNRSKVMSAWNKALQQLEANDTRVLFGMIVRNGEQLRTITLNKNIGNKDFSTSKKWQSSAFDNSNKIVNPPTSCLKIRHMFDASEIKEPNLKQLIVESIFEKVGPNCNICDIQLDTQSCCVYIRCASEADAGIVHNEINGWWFDKRLISIKFLRLERYLSRFPKSLSNSLYLKSSNVN